jgi:hypothetical protein
MQEQFLELMPFIKKARRRIRPLLSGGRVVIKDNVVLEHFVHRKELQEIHHWRRNKIDNQVHVGHDTVIEKMFNCKPELQVVLLLKMKLLSGDK